MIEKSIAIRDKKGFHLRSARNVCTKAMEYECSITFSFRDRQYNAKSLLSILSSCAQETDEILLRCDGADETDAMSALEEILTKTQI